MEMESQLLEITIALTKKVSAPSNHQAIISPASDELALTSGWWNIRGPGVNYTEFLHS